MTYYTVTQAPTRHTSGRAAPIAAELQAIADGFAKLPSEASLKRGRVWYAATVGGSANAITLTMAITMTTPYVAGDIAFFKAASDNTGATTINIDGIGAVAILQPGGAALAAGNIQADSVVLVAYNGTNWILAGGYVSADQLTLAAIAADISAVAAIAANVTTVAGIGADVTAVAAIASDVTVCADNIAAIQDAAALVDGDWVEGPASATDHAVARFDLTTGKLIQNSAVTVDDSGNVAGVANLKFATVKSGTTSYAASTTAEIDVAAGAGQTIIYTLDGDGAIDLAPAASGEVYFVIVLLKQDGTGSRNFTHKFNGATTNAFEDDGADFSTATDFSADGANVQREIGFTVYETHSIMKVGGARTPA